MEQQIFSSELQLSSTTVKLFHVQQFTTYTIHHYDIVCMKLIKQYRPHLHYSWFIILVVVLCLVCLPLGSLYAQNTPGHVTAITCVGQ